MPRWRWAIEKDGKRSRCYLPPDQVGKGRCPHVAHQFDDETTAEFTDYINKARVYKDGEMVPNPAKMNKAILREHNRKSYRDATRALEKYGKCAVIQPTGSGKSSVLSAIADDYKDENVVLVVPKNQIGVQFLSHERVKGRGKLVFVTYDMIQTHSEGSFEDVKAYVAAPVDPDDPDQGYKRVQEPFDFKSNVALFMLDEVHRAGAKQWGKALKDFIAYASKKGAKVVGATATPDRTDGVDVVKEFCGGHTVGNIYLREAIEKEVLPMPKYVVAPKDVQKLFDDKFKEVVKNKSVIEGAAGPVVKKLQDAYVKYSKEAKDVREVVKEHLGEKVAENEAKGTGTKVLVFLNSEEEVKNELTGVDSSVKDVLEYALKGKKVTYGQYTSISTEDDFVQFGKKADPGEVKVLYTIEKFTEGIHMEGLDVAVMARPTDSEIVYRQQVGRVLDIKKADEGVTPLVIDLVGNHSKFEDWSSLEEVVNSRKGESKKYFYDETGGVYDALREVDLDVKEAGPQGKYLVGEYKGRRVHWDEVVKDKPSLAKLKELFKTQRSLGKSFEEALRYCQYYAD